MLANEDHHLNGLDMLDFVSISQTGFESTNETSRQRKLGAVADQDLCELLKKTLRRRVSWYEIVVNLVVQGLGTLSSILKNSYNLKKELAEVYHCKETQTYP